MPEYRVPRTSSDGIVVVTLLALVIGVLARAWAIMLLVGIFHAETGLPPSTIGFGVCIPIALLFSLLSTNVKTG